VFLRIKEHHISSNVDLEHNNHIIDEYEFIKISLKRFSYPNGENEHTSTYIGLACSYRVKIDCFHKI